MMNFDEGGRDNLPCVVVQPKNSSPNLTGTPNEARLLATATRRAPFETREAPLGVGLRTCACETENSTGATEAQPKSHTLFALLAVGLRCQSEACSLRHAL